VTPGPTSISHFRALRTTRERGSMDTGHWLATSGEERPRGSSRRTDVTPPPARQLRCLQSIQSKDPNRARAVLKAHFCQVSEAGWSYKRELARSRIECGRVGTCSVSNRAPSSLGISLGAKSGRLHQAGGQLLRLFSVAGLQPDFCRPTCATSEIRTSGTSSGKSIGITDGLT
jgi:hypothetical protein